ncbi:putative TLC domain-containing protein [Helianthus anomalus]
MFPKWSFDLCKRMVSSIHVVFAVILCSIFVQDWRCPMFLELSLAYFIYDLVCCWLDNNIGIDNLAHHVI